MTKHNKNIFLMPCGSNPTNKHFKNTILKPVKQAVIFPHIGQEIRDELKAVFGDSDISVWGSRRGTNTKAFYNKMQSGDHILFTVGSWIRVYGQIACKTINPELSQALWESEKDQEFSLIYFIKDIKASNAPLKPLLRDFGYLPKYTLRGLTSVSKERLEVFYKNNEERLLEEIGLEPTSKL